MSKTIPVETIKAMSGKPIRVPDQTEDGETKYKVEPKDGRGGVPETKDASTVDLMKLVVLSIPRSIMTSNDPLRVTQMWHRLDVADGQLEMHDKLYDWLHRLLKRDIPLTAEEKQLDMKPIPYAQYLWGIHAPAIIEQFKEPSERKDLDDLDLG